MNKNRCPVCGRRMHPKFRANNVKYCSKECRESTYKAYRAEFQRKRDDSKAIKAEGKIQCLICKLWYRQLGTHITQRHGILAQEYKEYFDLEVSKGLLSPELKELKAQYAIDNGTYQNLKHRAIHRYKKGDKRAGNYKRSHITIEMLRNYNIKRAQEAQNKP